MTENEKKLEIKFFIGLYDGGDDLQKDVLDAIKKSTTPINLNSMDSENPSILRIGSSLDYYGKNEIREILPDIVNIIERAYNYEILEKKKAEIKEEEKIFWIPIKKLSEGQFSNECAIIIELTNDKKISLFVHRDLINYCPHCGSYFLKSQLIKKNENDVQVLLPNEAFETQTRHAEIGKKRLSNIGPLPDIFTGKKPFSVRIILKPDKK